MQLFDVHIIVKNRHLAYLLGPDQSANLYNDIERFISSGLVSGGIDLTFKESDGPDHETAQTFRIDGIEAVSLLRRLEEHLQQHYPGSKLPIPLREVAS